MQCDSKRSAYKLLEKVESTKTRQNHTGTRDQKRHSDGLEDTERYRNEKPITGRSSSVDDILCFDSAFLPIAAGSAWIDEFIRKHPAHSGHLQQRRRYCNEDGVFIASDMKRFQVFIHAYAAENMNDTNWNPITTLPFNTSGWRLLSYIPGDTVLLWGPPQQFTR
ncbi:hypothetical protein AVEN_37890-1 [Araneus ventricosus]|uniref:Uncharacterized protein n=1 Tax=Araneus ventricosus TaxID=182803 RepID=A0A4Y2UXM9_ARAVE|nr:hypothetical protein AVEN_37890-1 [Araneus ventricosus]